MAQGKGGVYGSFVMLALKGGTSKRYGGTAQKALPPAGGTDAKAESPKSNLVFVKEPIAKFFGFEIAVPMDVVRSSMKDVTTKISGQSVTRKVMSNQGATGASRSVTIKFAALQKIGGKDVASVKMAMPSSHTFGDMVQLLMTRTNASVIAQIVSPTGRAMTFKTPYNSSRKKTTTAKK
jgi:hypothetical protein